MKNTATIGVRVGRDLWTRFNVEAQALGLSLGTYVRRRLEDEENLTAKLDVLRTAVERGAKAPPPAAGLPPLLEGAIVELLLLLRQMVGPQKALVAQKEVERRGLPAWR